MKKYLFLVVLLISLKCLSQTKDPFIGEWKINSENECIKKGGFIVKPNNELLIRKYRLLRDNKCEKQEKKAKWFAKGNSTYEFITKFKGEENESKNILKINFSNKNNKLSIGGQKETFIRVISRK